MRNRFLYIGAELPALSETFVYGELFALRDHGVSVVAASLHTPGHDLGDTRLNALASEVIAIYGRGPVRLLADAFVEMIRRPARSLQTISMGLFDAACSCDVRFSRRPKVIWQVLAALALAHRVRPLQITHIHAHMAHVPTTIAMYVAMQLDISFSFTGHANDLFPQRTLLPEKLRRARFVACISRWHRTFYREWVNLPDERLPIIRCGVEITEPNRKRTTARNVSRIMAVGRLIPKKGFDLLIRAVVDLAACGHDVDCHIVGEGPQRRELQELINRSGAAGYIKLLGAQHNTEVKSLLADADLFVLPCRIEPNGDRDGIPVALMEAMAAGVCVVSGDLPAIRELVIHDRTGLLVPPGDPRNLAATMRKLLTDSPLRMRLAQEGRSWVATEFSRDTNTRRLLAHLNTAENPVRDRSLVVPKWYRLAISHLITILCDLW